YGTPSSSSCFCTVPSSPYVPCSARNTTSVRGGKSQSGVFGSSSCTVCPTDRSARATATPVRNDTSRSALGPPSITVMFIFSISVLPRVRGEKSFADNLHFRFQFDPALRLRRLLDELDQFQNVLR